MKITGFIPARYASTRFPGKPLVMIDGKSMIQRVYEQSCNSRALSAVYVATDDQRISRHVEEFGGNVLLTSPDHQTGTERCREALSILESRGDSTDVVINIQGDEPFIRPEQIDQLASCFLHPEVEIATLAKKVNSADELFSPNVVKVVTGKNGKALYFSRSPIPFLRNFTKEDWLLHHEFYKHVGIYAYRSKVLKDLTSLTPHPLETAESLEQLRWLGNGYHIKVEFTDFESIAIDTPEDLIKIQHSGK